MSVEVDEALEDEEREHRYRQAALQRKRTKLADGKVLRYERTYDESERHMCDAVWIDRLTGKEVIRYDAADPANTNNYYGASSEMERFESRGLDIYEQIDATDAKPMPRFPVYYDGEYDDGEDW